MNGIDRSDPPTRRLSPGRILVYTILGIFLADVVAMLLVTTIQPLGWVWQILLDAFIMTTLIIPLLFFLSFKPLLAQLAERERAEVELRQAHTGLEQRVQERTTDLVRANESLQQAMTLHQQTDDALQEALETSNAYQREITSLLVAARSVLKHQPFSQAARSIYTSCQSRIGATSGFIAVTRGEVVEAAYMDSGGFPCGVEADTPLEIHGLRLQPLLAGNPLIQNDVSGSMPRSFIPDVHFTIQNMLLVPLMINGEMVGLIGLSNKPGGFTQNDARAASAFAEMAAVALLNSYAEDELRKANTELEAEIAQHRQLEAALNESQRKYQDLIETTSEFIWEMDEMGRYTYCSPQMETLWGMNPAEMLGKTPFDVMPPGEQEKYVGYFKEIIASATPFRGLISRSYNSQGEETYIETSGVPFFDPDGRLLGYRGISRDITERMHTEEKVRRAFDELEHRVQERTRKLVMVNEQLQAQVARREQVDQALVQSTGNLVNLRQLTDGLVQSVIALNSSLELDDVLDAILEQLRYSIPYTVAFITEIEDGASRLARCSDLENHPEFAAVLLTPFPTEKYPVLGNKLNADQPFFIENMAENGEKIEIPGADWVMSYMMAPLITSGKLNGRIHLFSDQPGTFNQESAQFLMAFAAPAALAIENAKVYTAESRARNIAEILSTASLELSKSLDIDIILDRILEHTQRIIPYDMGGIALVDNRNNLVVHAVRGNKDNPAPTELTNRVFNSREWPHIQAVLDQRKTLLIPDTNEFPGWKPFFGPDARNLLEIPLVFDESTIGILMLARNETNFFTREHAQLAEAMVSQASVAIQNAWLFDQVRNSSERLQFLAHRLVDVQESKLGFVARELHDEIGQALTSVVLGLKLIETQAGNPEEVRAEVDSMNQVLGIAMDNLHRLAVDLRPASLDQLGLEAALRQHIKVISERSDLDIRFEMLGIGERLPPQTEIALYRIAQEALNNTVRHAMASRVDILLQTRNSSLILIIEDDGVGFDLQSAMQGGRLGIFGMRERAELLGGKLILESSPGNGTTVLVEVPYEHSNSHR